MGNNRLYFVVFTVWWTVAAWIGYTVAGEKMPWLLTHMALPMCVLGGWWLGNMLRHVDWAAAWRNRTWLLVFAVPVLSVLALVLLVATSPNGEVEPARRILQWAADFCGDSAQSSLRRPMRSCAAALSRACGCWHWACSGAVPADRAHDVYAQLHQL